MGIGEEETQSSRELRFRIDTKGIYGEMEHNYHVWMNSDTKESLGNLGIDQGVEIKGGPFDYGHFNIGTDYIYEGNKDKQHEAEFRVNLYLNDSTALRPDKGYINGEGVQRLQELLQKQGFNSVMFTDGEIIRYFRLQIDGRDFILEIGDPSLEEDIKGWESMKIGDKPEHNNWFALKAIQKSGQAGSTGLPLTEKDFSVNANALLEATKRVVWASDEYFGIGKTECTADFESTQTLKEKQRQILGFSVTGYDEGEYETNGEKGENVYGETDDMYWNKHQQRISEWRGIGNRQVLTMHKDRLVFGRWSGQAASRDGTQADVLISEDIDSVTHKVMQELGVSRRHFALNFEEEAIKALEDKTKGAVTDSVVYEDLNPTNTTFIFRGSRLSATLFGPSDEVDKGSRRYILPGDLILVGGGNYPPQKTEDWINHKSRGIGLVYLGERKFVKVNIGASDGVGIVKDIMAVVRPDLLEDSNLQGILKGKTDAIMNGDTDDDPVISQALEVIDRYESKLKAKEGYNQEQIRNMPLEVLFDLIGNSEIPKENAIEHALFAVTQRDEPQLVGYALLSAFRLGSFQESLDLLSNSEIWKKLPEGYVLQALDYIENSDITDKQKGKYVNIAYQSRDDSVKRLIRKRNERYIAKGLTTYL